LRRLMKAVAWCYCQLSVTRHHAPPTVTRNLSTISKCWNRRKVRVSSITEWRGCHIVVAQPLHSDQRLELQFPVRNRAPPGQCISSPAAYLFATTRQREPAGMEKPPGGEPDGLSRRAKALAASHRGKRRSSRP
jgi:hypothetical protein